MTCCDTARVEPAGPTVMGIAIIATADATERALARVAPPADHVAQLLTAAFLTGRLLGRMGGSDRLMGHVMRAVRMGVQAGQRGR